MSTTSSDNCPRAIAKRRPSAEKANLKIPKIDLTQEKAWPAV